MADAGRTLERLAELLRSEGSELSGHVTDAADAPAALGRLVAAGSRARHEPEGYAFVVEAMREGYLLHYASPRLLETSDGDLALLAGDYLYALGLERLAGIGDLDAVRELADLISLCAQLHGGGRDPANAEREAGALWLASAVAVATGASPAHRQAKAALRAGAPGAAERLAAAAALGAREAGLESELAAAADAIDFRPDAIPELG